MPKLDPDGKISVTACEDFEGCKCIIQHFKMPMMVTNRSIPVLFYLKENADGTVEFIASSRGTEAVVAAQAAVIKKNVVGINVINYVKLTPTEGGCDWVSVQCMDMGGSMPDAMKRMGAER